jgi:glycosyltransferase involved in cell wall biosynthesis
MTVVIPTFNREAVLKKALEGYLAQTAVQSIRELIVVDDGSTDNTAQMVKQIEAGSPFEIRYLRQANKGPAAARNLGIQEARAKMILFTDSDIIPDKDLVRQHLDWHAKDPDDSIAILGYVTWPSTPAPTPFMSWYGKSGPLFAFNKLQHGEQANFQFFYTCNLSLKTDFLRMKGQFDEEFKLAAFEDIELGYRLEKAGMRLIYNSAAVGYHHQFFSFAEACQKARAGREAGRLFAQKVGGKYLSDQSRRQKSRLSRRFVVWVAVRMEWVVRPVRGLLDSHIPLPPIVYRLFWNYFTHSNKSS